MPRSFRLDLSTERISEVRNIPGNFLKVIEASSDQARVSISFDAAASSDSSYSLNDQAEVIQPFTSLYVSNAAQPGEWVRVLVSAGDETVNYPKNVSLSGVLDGIKAGGTLTTGQVAVTTSAALGLAANTNAKHRGVLNTHATANLYYGGATVTTANGMKIPPGAFKSIPFRGDLYLVGDAALTACVEEIS